MTHGNSSAPAAATRASAIYRCYNPPPAGASPGWRRRMVGAGGARVPGNMIVGPRAACRRARRAMSRRPALSPVRSMARLKGGARRGIAMTYAIEPAAIGHDIATALQTVRARIAEAARSVGRDPAAVTLVAVGKAQPEERIVAALEAGQRVFGEN